MQFNFNPIPINSISFSKMKLEPTSSSCIDDDLRYLLDAFGSMVSLEDIASAYNESGRDASAAAEILLGKPESSSFCGSSTSKSQDWLGVETSAVCGSSDNHVGQDNGVKVKQKRYSASMGNVAGMIGRDYGKSRPQSKGSCESYKPLKLNSDEIPVSTIWGEKEESESKSKNEAMSSDVEEFVFELLGSGFKMDKTVIQGVIGQCGYDMQMEKVKEHVLWSVDKLLDMSAKTLGKSDDVISSSSGHKMANGFAMKSTVRSQSSPSDPAGRPNTDKPGAMKQGKEIQKEILESLFCVTKKYEEDEPPSLPVRRVRYPYGRIVANPLKDTVIEDFTFITRGSANNAGVVDDEADDKSYEDCRNAVKEYWHLMKEYYKAAVDAFGKKEYEKAQKLGVEGNFYMKKAREADEESHKIMIESSDDEEDLCINVHHFDPRDALRHLKLQLKSFAGLDTYRNMKVVVGTNGGDAQDVKRKRLVTKLLEKEKIPWTEEGNGWTICIRVDEVDRDELSFAKE